MNGLLKPDTIRISDLLKSVVSADFVLPRFQRDFTWNVSQVIDLLNSIYEQIPIGVFLLWDSDQLGQAFRFIGDISPNNTTIRRHSKYVLDGQQRLTSLLFVFRPEGINFPESIIKKYQIYFSFNDEKFYKKCPKGHKCFPAEILGSNKKFMEFYSKTIKNAKDKDEDILEKLQLLRDYEVPLLIFDEKISVSTVCTTFQYINSKGTPLSLMNLIAAKTYALDVFDLYEKIDDTRKIIEDADFHLDNFNGEDIIRALAIYNGIDNRTKAIIENLKTNHFVKDYKRAQMAYLDTLIFIRDDIGVPINLVPYKPMFVPLSTFFMKKRREELSSSQVNFIKHWFWRSSFNNRYGSESAAVGVTDSKILINGTDLRNVNGLNRPLFSPADLVEAASGSAIGKAFLGLLQSYKPLDLYSNIDLRIKGVQKRKKRIKSIDKHHIFPKDKREQSSINQFCL